MVHFLGPENPHILAREPSVMRTRTLGMAGLSCVTLRSGGFMHRGENFKSNWQTSLALHSCWYDSTPPSTFTFSFLSLDIVLCFYDSQIFLQIVFKDFWISTSLSQYICHQSAVLVLKIHRPNVCLSIIPSFPFPQRTQVLWVNKFRGNTFYHFKTGPSFGYNVLLHFWLQSKSSYLYQFLTMLLWLRWPLYL